MPVRGSAAVGSAMLAGLRRLRARRDTRTRCDARTCQTSHAGNTSPSAQWSTLAAARVSSPAN